MPVNAHLPFYPFLLLAMSVAAQDKPVRQEEILIIKNENQEVYELEPYLRIFEDTSAALTFDQVRTIGSQNFIPLRNLEKKPSPESILWIKLTVLNQVPGRNDWILSIGTYRSPDLVTGYVLHPSGDVSVAKSGAVRPYQDLAIKDRINPLVPVSLEGGKTTTVFLKIRTVTKRQVSFSAQLETPEHVIQQSKWWNFSQAAFHGPVFLFALLGMAFFFMTRDRTYLYLSLWLLNMNVLFLGITGMGSDILGLPDPSKYIFIGHVTQSTSAVFYFLFIKNFGQVRKLVPNLMVWINFAVGSRFVLIPLQHIILLNDLNYNIITAFAVLGNLIDIPIIFVIAYHFFKANNKISYYVAAGSGVVFLSSFVGSAGSTFFNLGEAPLIIEVGVIFLLILFVVGLGHRMKINEEEKRKTQQQLIDQLKHNRDLQDQVNRELEEKVRIRTEKITRQSKEILKQNNILAKSNKEKEVLLAEVHHRVKNNLQIVSSLLSIQSEQVVDTKAKQIVQEGQSRIQAMGFIHENIYKNESLAFIDMGTYIRTLGISLIDSFGLNEGQVRLDIQTSNLKIDVDTAIPMGLILNELITNSLKHAFQDQNGGNITIDLNIDKFKTLNLAVADNGTGHPSTPGTSFGLLLVKELTHQLKGSINFHRENGFKAIMKFKKFNIHLP